MSMKKDLALLTMLPMLLGAGLSDYPARRMEPAPPKPLTPDQLDRKFRAEQKVIELAEQKRIRKANRYI